MQPIKIKPTQTHSIRRTSASSAKLNDDSRTLAKSIGESLSKLRIPVGQVHTSLFRRAIDTGAMMGFGEVKASADYTEGGLMVTLIENNRRADALRKIVATVPPPGTNVIVVTHKPNILDAFGKDWFDVREGEASVFKPDGNGGYKPIVRIQAGAWSELAKDSDSFVNLYDLKLGRGTCWRTTADIQYLLEVWRANAPEGIRTPDPQILVLYPAELPVPASVAE
jgi:hypothetical protein